MSSKLQWMAAGLALLLTTGVEATIDLTTTDPATSESFSVTFSREKNDTEYIPLGRTDTAQPLRVEFGVRGQNVHHSVSMNIVSDWFNIYNAASRPGKCSVYMEDNKMSEDFGTDTSKYLNVVYGNGDVAGTMYVYLKIEPAFVPAGTSETSDHTVSVTVHGGPTWVSPTKPDGQDKDESDGVLDLTDYSDAKMVHLGNLGIAQVTKVNFPKNDNGKENWVPLGRFNFNDFLSMNILFAGQGTSHNMHLDLATDYMPVRITDPLQIHKDKITAFILANEKDEKVQYVEVMYRQLKDTSHVYLYLKLGKEFITCGTNQKCIDSQRSITIRPLNPPASYLPGGEGDAVDANFDSKMYLAATKVNLAQEVIGDSKYQLPLTTDKTDVDLVPLGAVSFTESTSFKVGIEGWGSTHSMILDVTTDWFNQENVGNAENRTTVFVKDTKSHLNSKFEVCTDDGECKDVHGQHNANAYWDIWYANSKDRNMVYIYLALEPQYWGCDFYAERDSDPSIKVQCDAAAHSVKVHASGGLSYLAGNVDGGFDADLVENMKKDDWYFKALKVDVGAIPVLEERLANVTASNAAQDSSIDDLSTANAAQDSSIGALSTANTDQDGLIAGLTATINQQDLLIDGMKKANSDQDDLIDALTDTNGDQDAVIKDLQDSNADLHARLAKVEAWMAAVPVPADKLEPTCNAATTDCPPEVTSSTGSNLALAATGGAVTFTSGGCKETDLCNLALDVEALKAKFN